MILGDLGDAENGMMGWGGEECMLGRSLSRLGHVRFDWMAGVVNAMHSLEGHNQEKSITAGGMGKCPNSPQCKTGGVGKIFIGLLSELRPPAHAIMAHYCLLLKKCQSVSIWNIEHTIHSILCDRI